MYRNLSHIRNLNFKIYGEQFSVIRPKVFGQFSVVFRKDCKVVYLSKFQKHFGNLKFFLAHDSKTV